ncbi:MAG TPA: hypothetical protein VJ623_11635 [Holophagaceae bacterium]|nr:hypothetical protein [Holophagaceae bacterium]
MVRTRTYGENLQRLAEARWREQAALWLQRHGMAPSEPIPAPGPPPVLRGVRGLTADSRPTGAKVPPVLKRPW